MVAVVAVVVLVVMLGAAVTVFVVVTAVWLSAPSWTRGLPPVRLAIVVQSCGTKLMALGLRV